MILYWPIWAAAIVLSALNGILIQLFGSKP